MRKRRRGLGEGTIFQRRDGRWVSRLTLGWEGGRCIRWESYSPTEAEAQDKLLKARYEHSRGLPVAVERQTVAQFLEHWLSEIVKPSRRPRTYESYELTVRLHIVPTLGKVRLEKMTPQQVQNLINRKAQEGKLSSRTIAYIRAILRQALNQALKWGLVARNAAALTSRPRIAHYAIRPLDDAEARRLLDAAKGTRFEAAYVIALNLGLRRGELLGLRWQDVNLDTATLRVNQAVQRVDGKLQAAETKTDSSRRNLSLPQSVVAALRAHRIRQLQERLLAGITRQDSGLVFTSHRGTPLEPRNLLRDFARILQRAQVPRVRFHDLRHSAASLLLAQGIPMRLIQEILGHSSIAMTADLYAHVAPTLMREAAAKMDALLG
jgi:integrase